jgi:hypothetical protein
MNQPKRRKEANAELLGKVLNAARLNSVQIHFTYYPLEDQTGKHSLVSKIIHII